MFALRTGKMFDWCAATGAGCCARAKFKSVRNDDCTRIITIPVCRLARCSRFATRQRTKASSAANMRAVPFKFTDYNCIGFDLDNTLSRYQVASMLKMEYAVLSRYLIDEKNYPSKYLSSSFDEGLDFLARGLILDVEKGNVLRVASDGYILKACHGTKPLQRSEIIQIYGNDSHWELTDLFLSDPLTTWNGPNSEKMRTLLDYFDMPASLAFARCVDTLDELSSESGPKYSQVWPDILDGLQEMFRREHFQLNKGNFFTHLKDCPEKYYFQCSEELRAWLKELRKQKIMLFLITGSNVDFASLTAENTLGKEWRDLFDVVVCYAKKPGFFTEQRPFIKLDGFKEVGEVRHEDLALGEAYSNGNWRELYELIKARLGEEQPNILYVGDNLVQDIYSPAVHTQCDTVSICEELEAEGVYGFEPVHAHKEYLTSKFWGSYFEEKETGQRTMWFDIMKKYSKLYVPSLEYVASKKIDHEFCNV